MKGNQFSIRIHYKGKDYTYTAELAGRDRRQDVWHVNTRRKKLVLINKRPYNSSPQNHARPSMWESPDLEDLKTFVRCLTEAIEERELWYSNRSFEE
ncbi:MAG: hypothetical protein DI535_14120 [Citrobacter freundii]|nr:MAG: hypothetical protein DI535_14120 [Citrobacter freundii]